MKSLMPGTNFMMDMGMTTIKKTSCMTSEDIVKIIKACKKTDISEITIGDVHMVFGVKQSKVLSSPLDDGTVKPFEQSPMTEEERTVERETEFELEQQEELQQLAISDPLEYEKRLSSGELIGEES